MTLDAPVPKEPCGLPELHVSPERCVHSLFEQASCRACVDACPTSSWSIDGEGLNLDTTLCDGCGLCTAACPQEVLSVRLDVLSVEIEGERVALAACDHAGVSQGDGVIPCVHSLSVRALARLAAQGIEAIATATDDCANCDRGTGERLEQRLPELNRLLQSRSHVQLVHHPYPPAAWQALLTRTHGTPAHSMERRRFLRGGLRELARLAQGLDEPDPPARPQPVTSLLGRTGTGLAEWRPRFDEANCDGCNACIRLCPTQSLELDDALYRYRVFPDLCTGCRVCHDVCETGAITPVPWGDASPYTVRLRPRRCRACGVEFHLPETRDDGEDRCPTCRQVNHYRHLFQVLD
ncbi:MAG TPA: 4Fe-4S binding protein [Thioalkalivibrio sp.]|nr:4Fe-4S binding protein [Thioalkalivibrio sp.]